MAKISGGTIVKKQEEKKELAKATPLQMMLKNVNVQARFQKMLGDETESFMSSMLTVVNDNRLLANADPRTVLSATATAASLHLPILPTIGKAYLVPFKGACQFMLGYKGWIELAMRSGQMKFITAFPCREGVVQDWDPFTETIERGKATSDKVTGYYASFQTVNGFTKSTYWTREEVIAHAKRFSKSYGSGPWQTDFDAMACKGLALDTPIPTVNGWKKMEDIVVGDTLFDMNGKQTKVIAVSEVKHIGCYCVEFSNGEKIVCDCEHRWMAEYGDNAARHVKDKGWKVLDIETLFHLKEQGERIIVPVSPTVDLPKAELPVPPYVLGYWLGNGNSWSGNICCDVRDYDELVNHLLANGKYSVDTTWTDKRSNAVSFTLKGLKADLKSLGLIRNKHIPECYLFASKEQRLELLKGLVDSDGTISKDRGRVIFSTVDSSFANSVYQLVSSLGEEACTYSRLAKGYGKTTWCYIVSWKPQQVPAKLARKVERITSRQVAPYKSIKSITEIDSVPTMCIGVDSETKTYLASHGFIPTHNTVLLSIIKIYAPMSVKMQQAMIADGQVSALDENGEVETFDVLEAETTEQPLEPTTPPADFDVPMEGE